MMFILFTITFGCYIAEYCIFWNHGVTCAFYCMGNLYRIGDGLVHSIFVIKYWVLSMKVREIISEKKDKWLTIKAWTGIIL